MLFPFLLYMHIYKIFYILKHPNLTMVHSHRAAINVINKKKNTKHGEIKRSLA